MSETLKDQAKDILRDGLMGAESSIETGDPRIKLERVQPEFGGPIEEGHAIATAQKLEGVEKELKALDHSNFQVKMCDGNMEITLFGGGESSLNRTFLENSQKMMTTLYDQLPEDVKNELSAPSISGSRDTTFTMSMETLKALHENGLLDNPAPEDKECALNLSENLSLPDLSRGQSTQIG